MVGTAGRHRARVTVPALCAQARALSGAYHGHVGGVLPALPEGAFRVIVDTLAIPVLMIDGVGAITYANRAALRSFGYRPEELVGHNVTEFTPPDQADQAVQSIADLTEVDDRGIGVPTVFPVVRSDGTLTWHAIGAVPLLDHTEVGAITLFFLPWDGHRHLDESLAALLAGAPIDGVLAPLTKGTAATLEALGVALHHGFDGQDFASVTAIGVPDGALSLAEAPWHRAARTGVAQYLATSTLPTSAAAASSDAGLAGCWAIPLPDNESLAPAVLTVWRPTGLPPVTAHRFVIDRALRYAQLILLRSAEHQQLSHLASHDPLTGTANRTLLASSLATAIGTGDAVTVLYCDLDRFKAVNDAFGHAAGDAVLVELAQRLGGELRSGDQLARLGGDEFAIVVNRAATDAVAVAERLVRAVAGPFVVPGGEIELSLSVGLAVADAGVDTDALMGRADRALYDAKAVGGGHIAVWSADRHEGSNAAAHRGRAVWSRTG